MSKSWQFFKSVAIKTAWLTPVFITVNDLVAGPASIHGRSMQPTFNPEGSKWSDRVLVDKLSIRLYKYTRGDIVLFRLIGLEGDWVTLPDRIDVQKIPKGHCWVEGDNPALSEDSRSRYGAVPLALIEGRVTHVLWPPSRVCALRGHQPAGRILMQNPAALQDR